MTRWTRLGSTPTHPFLTPLPLMYVSLHVTLELLVVLVGLDLRESSLPSLLSITVLVPDGNVVPPCD